MVWGEWCSTNTTTCTTTTTVWYPWCNETNTTAVTLSADAATWGWWIKVAAPQVTPEQQARRNAELRRMEEDRKRAEQIRVNAEAKASELLRSLLNPEQRVQYDDKRRFYVITQSGKRFEVDCQERMHNVFEVDAIGRRLEEHCIYASGEVPLSDNAAAQLLLLMADEQRFRRIANQRRLIA